MRSLNWLSRWTWPHQTVQTNSASKPSSSCHDTRSIGRIVSALHRSTTPSTRSSPAASSIFSSSTIFQLASDLTLPISFTNAGLETGSAFDDYTSGSDSSVVGSTSGNISASWTSVTTAHQSTNSSLVRWYIRSTNLSWPSQSCLILVSYEFLRTSYTLELRFCSSSKGTR